MIRRLDRRAALVLALCLGASDGFQVVRAPVSPQRTSLVFSPHPRRAIHRSSRASLLPALNLSDGDSVSTNSNVIETKEKQLTDANGGDNTLAGATNKLGTFFLSLCIFLLPFFAMSPALAVQSGGRMGGSFSGSSRSRSSGSSRSYSAPSRSYGGSSSYSSGYRRGYSSGLSSGYSSRPSVTVVSPSYYRR